VGSANDLHNIIILPLLAYRFPPVSLSFSSSLLTFSFEFWYSQGVHEVYLGLPAQGHFRNAAMLEIPKSTTYKAKFGSQNVHDVAHNIVFCHPPSSHQFIASAETGGAISSYSDKWCGDLSTLVHEVGWDTSTLRV
jgi:hypothetical protein